MKSGTVLGALIVLNALLATGDVLAKRAVEGEARNISLTVAAFVIWIGACCMWLPLMRARGFTRLIILADVIGFVMLAFVGYVFLGERLTVREWCGVALSIGAVVLLAH